MKARVNQTRKFQLVKDEGDSSRVARQVRPIYTTTVLASLQVEERL